MSGWMPRVGRLSEVTVRWKSSLVVGGSDRRSRRATEVSSLEGEGVLVSYCGWEVGVCASSDLFAVDSSPGCFYAEDDDGSPAMATLSDIPASGGEQWQQQPWASSAVTVEQWQGHCQVKVG